MVEFLEIAAIVLLTVNIYLLRRDLDKKDVEINEILYELSNYERLDQIRKRNVTTLENKVGIWIK